MVAIRKKQQDVVRLRAELTTSGKCQGRHHPSRKKSVFSPGDSPFVQFVKAICSTFSHRAFQKAFMLPAPPCDASSLSLLFSFAPQQKCAQRAQSHRRRQRKRSCGLQRIKEYESKQLRQHPEQRRAGKHHLCSAARFCACCHTARKRRQRGRRRCCNAYSALPYRAVLDRRRFKRKQRQLHRQPRQSAQNALFAIPSYADCLIHAKTSPAFAYMSVCQGRFSYAMKLYPVRFT